MAMNADLAELLKGIPFGKVSTYKEIARKLGTSPRAVGKMLNKNKNINRVPCYKIVMSNGNVGGYALSINEKIVRLKKEGIKVRGRKIRDFEKVLFYFK